MSKRRALLIGVSEYESDAISNLPIVCQDLKLLHSSLEKSGFTVRSFGEDGLSYGRSKILQTLRGECKSARGVDTLLLYFSGHGMHFRGKDYLIPADAALDDAEAVEEYLVPIDLSRIIDESDAKSVIFFVDACREGVKLGFKDTYLAGWGRGDRKKAARRSFVLVFACGPGQVSQYVSGENGFSLFSQALANVIDPSHSACTLKAVLDATQENLNALANTHKKQSQRIYCAYEGAVEEDVTARIICNSSSNIVKDNSIVNPWIEAVLQSSLWPEESPSRTCPTLHLKEQISKILRACWKQWQNSIIALPQDEWRDEKAPIRVLESLELLVLRSNPSIELTIAETALAIVSPFVREAVLANGIVHAAKVEPLSLQPHHSKDRFRNALDKIHQAQPRFIRKAERLENQNRAFEKDAIMSWLLHLCLLKSLEIWQPESSNGYLSNDFINALSNTQENQSRLVRETLTKRRLLEFAYCMYADFERVERNNRSEDLKVRLVVGSYREEQVIREKMLACLLKLASSLAIDTRTLSDVIVDHIGLADPLVPEQVLQVVNKARWNPSGRGRTLTVLCDHPAIDLALHDYVGDIDGVLTHILRQVAEKKGYMEVLSGLPTYLQADGVQAEIRDNAPTYQLPHINFQLAHDEVRELLMGEQLYGDPMLAIRELYQNALDACRYRNARLKFLSQTDQLTQLGESWEGHIIFRQSVDEQGRAYIECEDNGIGMGMTHLSKCFSRAGRRFADLPEFIEEQADWSRCDPPIRLYPNSQFGVGVLSYFMLADEIELETCRLSQEGIPEERFQIRIPGSSGLFRAQRLGTGQAAGTKVRLYLNRTHHRGKIISCIETLRRLLWVAEFKTEVYQFGRQEFWKPGELRHPDLPQSYCLNTKHPDVWWIPENEYLYGENGCVLSDGLWTRESQPGFVVNLRCEHLPKLTVDRRDIVEWEKEWVCATLIKHSKDLLRWSHTDFNLLWKLSGRHPRVASNIVEALVNDGVDVRLGRGSSGNLKVPIQEIGCFEFDSWVSYFGYGGTIKSLVSHMPWWVLPYRLILWEKYGLFKVSEAFLESVPPSLDSKNFPVLKAGDSIVLRKDFPPRSYQGTSLQDFVSPAHIIHAAAKIGEPVVDAARRFQRLSLLGLKIPKIDLKSLNKICVQDEDLIALSREIRGFGRKQEQWKLPWIEPRISAAQIVLSATRLNESIAKTVERLSRFRPIGLDVIQAKAEDLREIDITPEDIIALSIKLDGEEALPCDQISPAQILFAAKRLNEPISETVKRFEKFSPLGVTLPHIELELTEDILISQEDLIALSEELDGVMEGKIAWSEKQLSVAQIVRAAQKLNESVSATVERVKRFVPFGLQLPKISLESSTDSFCITREDVIAFSEDERQFFDWRQKSSWVGNKVTPPHLIISAIRLDESIEESLQRFRQFEKIGLHIPEVDTASLESFIEDKDNLVAFSQSLRNRPYGPSDFLRGNIHPTRIILAALALGEPITTTTERFRRFADIFSLILPKGDVDTWNFFATLEA